MPQRVSLKSLSGKNNRKMTGEEIFELGNQVKAEINKYCIPAFIKICGKKGEKVKSGVQWWKPSPEDSMMQRVKNEVYLAWKQQKESERAKRKRMQASKLAKANKGTSSSSSSVSAADGRGRDQDGDDALAEENEDGEQEEEEGEEGDEEEEAAADEAAEEAEVVGKAQQASVARVALQRSHDTWHASAEPMQPLRPPIA